MFLTFKRSFTLVSLALLLMFTGCGGGDEDAAPADSVSRNLSGTVTYDFVPVSTSNALDYNNIIQKPVRGAKICAVGTSSQCQYTGEDGSYAFSSLSDQVINLYVYAKTDTITVEDNTNSDATYVMNSLVDLTTTSVLNLNAETKWYNYGSVSYYKSRVSAPFAILDTLYTTQKAFETADSTLVFPALKVNWSAKNISSTTKDVAIGDILTSHWDGTELYILGKVDSDTDEFDAAVLVHEWGHYFESKLSRSDSIGGSHSSGEIKDIRLAFGEGWGNALAGMMLADHTYRDTYGTDQQSGFSMDLEAGSDTTNPGWFSEASVQLILYDIFDSTSDLGDTVSLGLAPIIKVLTGAQKTTPALTSIFSFITALKAENATVSANIDSLTSNHSISTVDDIYGTGETHVGTHASDLAVYKSITQDGGTVDLKMGGTGSINNALENNRYLKFTAVGTSATITVVTTDEDTNAATVEDVAVYIYHKGTQIAFINTVYVGTETRTFNITHGEKYNIIVRGVNAHSAQYTAQTTLN